jgi:hypothetical protein
MAYTVQYNPALQIVELRYTGRLTAQEARESTSEAIALGKENGDADALVDATKAEVATSVFDLYDLPNRQYAAQGMNRRVRVAVIPPRIPKDEEAVRFYETACLNRGWQVRLFPSRDAAVEWLTGRER